MHSSTLVSFVRDHNMHSLEPIAYIEVQYTHMSESRL